MSDIDRDALLHHLSDLAAEDDAVVLAAARAANAMVTDGGLTWHDVLAPPPDDHDVDIDVDAGIEFDEDDDDADAIAPERDDGNEDQTVDDPAQADDQPDYPTDAKISESDAAEAKTIINTLLARKNLYEATRDELKDYREDLNAGDLHPADVSYLRALHKRLSKK